MNATGSHILAHYATGYEAQRLFNGPGQLERARTEELLARYLPAPHARVLDVGGGPGVYARWLVAKGYTVNLIDIVPLHVDQANQSFSEWGITNARADVGDARNLEFVPESQDAVLLMGPLYHLPHRMDRLRALREAWRVLKPGSLIAAVVISRYASLLVLGLEGPFWCLSSFEELWRDGNLRALMLGYLRQIEKEPSLLGASAHLLAIARKAAERAASRSI